MSFRYRDESSTGGTIATVIFGAVAGFAVGMFVAQRYGGVEGLAAKWRKPVDDGSGEGRHYATHSGYFDDAVDEIEETEIEDEGLSASPEDDDFNGMDDDGAPILEERVLEAFNNDPILAERAVDIGSLGEGIIELAGWVDSDEEAEHAMTIARGVPGVDTVVNRLMIGEEEELIEENRRRREAGDPALNDKGWEGQQVGIGKRRQGSSDEADRHADPKPVLEDRWLSEREAVRNAAEDISDISAERRGRTGKKKQAEAET